MFRTLYDMPVWGKPQATQKTFQAKNWLLPRKFSGDSGAILSSANFEFRGIFYRNRNSKSKSEKDRNSNVEIRNFDTPLSCTTNIAENKKFVDL